MKYIVIHCSDSPHGRGDDAETIHRWHTHKGWSGIGYHYVILEDGTVEKGRPEYWTGAHVRGYNEGSLGVCLIGVNEFTEAQWCALWGLIEDLTDKYPLAEVVGHRDLDPHKTCPNFSVKKWWAKAR